MNENTISSSLDHIAVIGMACRFPGARNVREFWENLRQGIESITFFSEEELAGIDPDLRLDPHYVPARAVIDDAALFDAGFFGYTPREAQLMDPQQRIFLECAWEALEDAGYASHSPKERIGIYAGAGMNTYLFQNTRELAEDFFHTVTSNDKDFLASRVAYKLNLRGPALTVQTACSTSLVAVHLACQSLLAGECELALAGGVSLNIPQKAGYLYQEGGIFSPDGHCRAFDAEARGTVNGDGVGLVVLKRLEDARGAGDSIIAVIRGSAINNDGSRKVGFTAPGIEGQAAVIAEAQSVALVEPDSLSYVEAHGTATPLGDPIEIAALTRAFLRQTTRTGFCAIGSVKTNIGHLDVAAGVAGLIKTLLALQHRQIPPSLYFHTANPQIDFARSPFYVNTQLIDWPAGPTPRRAGVSSFGIGGTNAHVILEEAPQREVSRAEARPWQLLAFSARTPAALRAHMTGLGNYLSQQAGLDLADVAFTLQQGRRHFAYRSVLVCQKREDAGRMLCDPDAQPVIARVQEEMERPVIFLFPGQGSQYIQMAANLYRGELLFREQVDRCAALLAPDLGMELRRLIYPQNESAQEAAQRLTQTAITQPALFVIEYALARLWMAWGIQPQAMLGHSIGEYVAACLAGVFSLEDALSLVAARGQMMQQLPPGAMMSVSLAEAELLPLLDPRISLAAINTPDRCVVAGPIPLVKDLEQQLTGREVSCRLLHTSHAFHSSMMSPLEEPFAERVSKVELRPPQIPYLSNVTGTWITAGEAQNPAYWARHLVQPVRFADCVQELWRTPERIWLEVGPGRSLGSLALEHPASKQTTDRRVFASLPASYEKGSDHAFLLSTLGNLWLSGSELNWQALHAQEQRLRVSLPTYPFERLRYWLAADSRQSAGEGEETERRDSSVRFSIPSWKRAPLNLSAGPARLAPSCILLFADTCGIAGQVARTLAGQGHTTVLALAGDRFSRQDDTTYTLDPCQGGDYRMLLRELRGRGQFPAYIVHCWLLTAEHSPVFTEEVLAHSQTRGFSSLLFLAQALGEEGGGMGSKGLDMIVFSNNMQAVTGEESLCPAKATVIGPCRVIPQEYPEIRCRSIDVILPAPASWQERRLIEQMAREVITPAAGAVGAYRGGYRWEQTFEPLALPAPATQMPRAHAGGVYLCTGGLGGVALELAYELAHAAGQIKLILLGRSGLPPRSTWESQAHTWDERRRHALQRIQEIERLGAEVFIVQADVTDVAAMRSALAMIHERFGPLRGIIHAAGLAGGGIIALKAEREAVEVLAPKVQGAWVLDQLVEEDPLDFFVLCSSVNAFLHEPGQVDYCAANAFLDAFAHYRSSKGHALTISINWDRWHNTGMARQAHALAQDARRAPEGLSLQEGRDAFSRVLASAQPQVIVSARDFPPVDRQPPSASEKHAGQPGETTSDDAEALQTRPLLSKTYTMPRNELERRLAEIWQQVLGIAPIGVDDNFFELGGHSVIALRIAAQVRKLLNQELNLQSLLEHPTIGELAVLLLQKKSDAEGSPGSPLVRVSRAAYRAERSDQGEIIAPESVRQRLVREKG